MAKPPTSKTKSRSTKPKARAGKAKPDQRRWRPYPRLLGLSVAKIARPLVGKRGFTEIDIISRWVDIVGEDMAAFTLPEKLTKPRSPKVGTNGLVGGTLHIRVSTAASATLLKYQEAELCGRINTHFGYTVVDKIKMTIGKIPKPRPKLKPPPLPPLSESVVDMVHSVDDPELKAALERLGQVVAAKTSPDKS